MSATPNLVMFNDTGEDFDDACALIAAVKLRREGKLSIAGTCVSTDPLEYRIQIQRGILEQLGAQDLPLACGMGDDAWRERGDELWFQQTPWCTARHYRPAATLLDELLTAAAPQSLTPVLMAPVTDVANYLGDENRRELFRSRTREVVIMGGIDMAPGADGKPSGVPKRDEKGRLLPDSAKNVYFDEAAGKYVMAALQDLGVPLRIVTRHAAMAATVPMTSMRRLKSTGHPLGAWIVDGLAAHFNGFWRNCNLPKGHPIRVARKMHDRQDATFFRNIILKGKGQDRGPEDSIDDLIDGVPLYDVLAVFAAVDSLYAELFDPAPFEVNGVTHQVIGLSPAHPGVRSGTATAAYVADCMLNALS